jgi:Tol biopolymer transport system component
MKTRAIRTLGNYRAGSLTMWRRTALLLVTLGLAGQVSADPFQLLSTVDPAQPPPAGGGGDSLAPVISPDGRYLLFASLANNLVLTSNTTPIPLQFSPKLNVFLRDRTNLTTTLVSVNLSGTAGGDGDSLPAGLSSNGRYALFESSASDLIPTDANNATDIFIRDLTAGTTLMVSVSTNGAPGNRASRGAVITPDGRFVAFVSEANDLVPGDSNGIADVFVRDLQEGTTTRVSVGALPSASLGASSSELPDITPDGRYVAFYSTAANLVAGAENSSDLYVRDLVSGTTTWASSSAYDAVRAVSPSTTKVTSYSHVLSTNGQFVAYQASAFPLAGPGSAGVILRYDVLSGLTDLVSANAIAGSGMPEDLQNLDMTPDGRFITFLARTNTTAGVYVWDAQTGTTTLASGDLSDSVPGSSICDWPRLDPSGRFVLFLSSAANLVTNPLRGDYHVFLRDLQAGTTALVDADPNGVGAALSLPSAPQITADGRFVVFECPDASLVPNDRNRDYDLFVRDVVGGTTELVSARQAILPSVTPNGPSSLSARSVSTDGRYVAFASEADNLVPGDTNGCRDVFVRDLVLGTNYLVSLGTNGAAANGISTDPSISGDGRYVAFASTADNLVAGDTNKTYDVFVADLQAGATVLVSAKLLGSSPGNASSHSPQISIDANYVLFRSKASNLTSGGAVGENLFHRNLQSGLTYALTTSGFTSAAMTPDGRYVAFGASSGGLVGWGVQSGPAVIMPVPVSISAVGISPDGNRVVCSDSHVLYGVDRAPSSFWTIGAVASGSHPGLRFSGDGRFLAYAAPLNGTNQIYLYDWQSRTRQLLSTNYTSGGAAYGASDSPDISTDGRFVAFRSAAINLVPGDTNSLPDVFLYDLVSGIPTLMSASRFANAAGDNRSLAPAFSGDGRTVLFQSWASDLVAQDFNQTSDLFAWRLDVAGQIPLFSALIVPGAGPGQGPWLIWPAVPGKTYTVQFKLTVHDPNWQPLPGSITILGSQACLNDTSAGPGPRLYRVVAN